MENALAEAHKMTMTTSADGFAEFLGVIDAKENENLKKVCDINSN
jgi:hypothetical protein